MIYTGIHFLRKARLGPLGGGFLVILLGVVMAGAGYSQGSAERQVAQLCDSAIDLYKAGNYPEALVRAEKAVQLAEKSLGDRNTEAARAMNTLGFLYKKKGAFARAEPLYRKSAEIYSLSLGENHPDTAVALNNLGSLYKTMGNYREAFQHLDKAWKIRVRNFGENDTRSLQSLSHITDITKFLGKKEEAEAAYQKILRVRRETLGEAHPETVESMMALASFYKDEGRFEEAVPLAEKSLEVTRAKLSDQHPYIIQLINNLAYLYSHTGRKDLAGPMYEKVVAFHRENFDGDHPSFLLSAHTLAMFYQAHGKHEESLPLVEEVLEGTRQYHSERLRYFPDEDCLNLQRRLYTNDTVGNSKDGRLAATEQLWFKGAVTEALNQRRLAEKRLADTEEGKKSLELRHQLKTAYQEAVFSKGDYDPSSLSLKQKLDEMERKIALLVAESSQWESGTVGVEDIQSTLREKEVLLEVFRYSEPKGGIEWEKRYASALIRKGAPPEYLSHGTAEELEEAIRSYREAVQGAGDDRTGKLAEAEGVIYRLLLEPVEAKLNPEETVIFSLDARLHFIAPGMIRSRDGVPFGRKFPVRYVNSGRDLVLPDSTEDGGAKSALLLGNPSYRDNSPLAALAEAADQEGSLLEVASAVRSGSSNDGEGIQLNPLPGTAREISRLAERLKKESYEVSELSRGDAGEVALVGRVQGHRILHLATHGFFLDELAVGEVSGETGSEGETRPNLIRDPMYRSGLALAGAQSTLNLWKDGEVPPPSKDGILLAAEANLLNLRGTDLVVLSACETASGEALDGEGVMGLRRAFASAGANNTIMTLWPVNDESTVEVMNAFYEKYLGGTHPAIALAEVQNELYEPFVEKYGEVEAIARLAPFVCMSLGKVE